MVKRTVGLIAGVLWVIIGALYIAYKIGEEVSGSGIGGIGCLVIVAGALVGFGAIVEISKDLAGYIFVSSIVMVIACVLIHNRIKKRKDERIAQERFEIRIIRSDLPMPTRNQMNSFINDIKHEKRPSPQQMIYWERIRKMNAGLPAEPVDAGCFKDMQAAWIFYSQHEYIRSSERRRLFGKQNLAEKEYFEPRDHGDDDTIVASCKGFRDAVENLSVKISDKWLEYPKFTGQVFAMIENGERLSEESLYPIMLESRSDKPLDISLSWMRHDIDNVWRIIYQKVLNTLSQVPMSKAERSEWLRVDSFVSAVMPIVKERRCAKNEEIFPVLHRIYNNLIATSFGDSYDFVALWHGLNSVGRAIGRTASFYDYPKYICESKDSKEVL